jgi:hypothetical protein
MTKPLIKTARGDRFIIEVTEKDIARAHQNDSYKCVVAQAIARNIPDAHRIEVDTQAIRFTRTSTQQRYVYLTPYAVQGYVIAFDAGEKIEPFRFGLNERGLLRAKRRILTPAGKIANAAAKRAHTRARRRPSSVVTGSQPPVEPGSQAREIADRDNILSVTAREAYAQARAANPGPITSTNDGERRAPRRVFKTRVREYGHRVLRINQPTPTAPAQ